MTEGRFITIGGSLSNELDDYVGKCFGGTPLRDGYRQFLENLIPVYKQFVKNLNFGNAVVAANMFIEDNPLILKDFDSLEKYDKKLDHGIKIHDFKIQYPYEGFRTVRNLSYSEEELNKFAKEGKDEADVILNLFHNALAYSYWCMVAMTQGRRIGAMRKNPQGEVILTRPFYELTSLESAFPMYDSLKSYSVARMDPLFNTTQSELVSRLSDAMDLFNESLVRGEKNSVLENMAKDIEWYSYRLKRSPVKIFRSLGWMPSQPQKAIDPPKRDNHRGEQPTA